MLKPILPAHFYCQHLVPRDLPCYLDHERSKIGFFQQRPPTWIEIKVCDAPLHRASPRWVVDKRKPDNTWRLFFPL